MITQPCSEMTGTEVLREFTELFFVIETDNGGADIREAYVDYRTGGQLYRLEIDWEMITCGWRIQARDNGEEWCRK